MNQFLGNSHVSVCIARNFLVAHVYKNVTVVEEEEKEVFETTDCIKSEFSLTLMTRIFKQILLN